MLTYTNNDSLADIGANGSIAEDIPFSPPTAPGIAALKTPDGIFLIRERRSALREPGEPAVEPKPRNYCGSPQMMALGGLIIIGVLFASYTAKYDAAIGHAHGTLAVPAVGYLALQLFLARAALRLYDDVRSLRTPLDFVISRAFRYMPAVIPSVLLGFFLVNVLKIPAMHADAASLPANLFLVADLIGVRDIDSSHWRLKIEIIQAVLVAAAWFGPMKRFLPFLLTFGLMVAACSVNGEPSRHDTLTLHGFMTSDGYLPLFVFGLALHHLTRDRGSRIWRAILGASAALVFLSNSPLHGACMVASLGVLTLIAFGRLQGLGRWRWLCHLGEIAFPIYVVHYVLGFAVIHRIEGLGGPPLLAIAVAAVAAIASGKALNALVERPLQSRGPALIKAIARAVAAMAPTIWPQMLRRLPFTPTAG